MVKRILASVLTSSIVMGLSVSGFADSKSIKINEISVDKNRITVETTNTGSADAVLTMTLSDSSDVLFSFQQETVESGKSFSFITDIPEEREGKVTTGTYTLCVQNNGADQIDRETRTFNYANETDVAKFASDLKAAVKSVTNNEKAYETLFPIIDEASKIGVFFSIGYDYETFSGYSSEVISDALNILCKNITDGTEIDDIPRLLSEASGLSLYNNGKTMESLGILKPKFANKDVKDELLSDTLKIMAVGYETTEKFTEGFKNAYALTIIKHSTVNDMESSLDTYSEQIGACTDIIGKIKSLVYSKKYATYQDIISALDKESVSTSVRLGEILESVYADATKSGESGGGTGSSGNRKPTSSSGIGGTASSGTYNNGKTDNEPNKDNQDENNDIFSDLPNGHWAAKSVETLKNSGIISGTGENKFEPDRSVTREEFVKMLVLVCGFENKDSNVSFGDMSDDDWFAPYVKTAVANGVVTGIGNGLFGTGSEISRQDMTVMTVRALDIKGLNIDKIRDYDEFVDDEHISDYAKDAVCKLFEAQIISGKGEGRFDPTGTATRAEAAKILCSAFVK